MSSYIHHEAAGQNVEDVVNPSITYHQPSAQPQPTVQFFGQSSAQFFDQPSAHASGHSSTPMSAQTSVVEATYPAGLISGFSTHHVGDSLNNNNQVAYGQHHSTQTSDVAMVTNSNNFSQHYSTSQPSNNHLHTVDAAREVLASPGASNLDLFSNHSSMGYHGFAQNNTLSGQQVDFQALANMNSMNNMAYYPQQHVFMPQFPFNMMMPIQYGQRYNMYGQVYNTPNLPVMEPPVQTMMGPPSTIVSSVENWRHRVSSPTAESHTTATSAHQKISPHVGFNTFGFDNCFNPAVLSNNSNPVPTSEVDDSGPADRSPIAVKPVIKKKKYSKTRSCFICTGINNANMITCAHPDHKGTTMFHLDCAGLSSKTDNGK